MRNMLEEIWTKLLGLATRLILLLQNNFHIIIVIVGYSVDIHLNTAIAGRPICVLLQPAKTAHIDSTKPGGAEMFFQSGQMVSLSLGIVESQNQN